MLYGSAVQEYLRTGKFHILLSNAFNFIPIQLGILICSFTGFSYDYLRTINIGFHVFGSLGLYLSLKQTGIKPLAATIFCSAYVFNPFLLNLSFTFMSDTAALALSNWIFYFAARGLATRKLQHWLLALLSMSAAMSVRQTSLCFAFPLILFALISIEKKSNKLIFLVSLAAPSILYVMLQEWLRTATEIPSCYEFFSNSILSHLGSFLALPDALFNFDKALCYLGLFAIPFSLPIFFTMIKNAEKTLLITATLITLLTVTAPLAVLLFIRHELMPFHQNLFSPPYLGTYQLVGAETMWQQKYLFPFSIFAWLQASILSFVLTLSSLHLLNTGSKIGLILAGDLSRWKASYDAIVESELSSLLFCFFSFACCLAALTAVLLLLETSGLDRYFTITFAPLLLLLAGLWAQFPSQKSALLNSATLSFLIAIYGILALSDNMNFNRAQWKSIRQLESGGIAPLRIDGGPEYNFATARGAYLTGLNRQTRQWPVERRGGPIRSQHRWWPVNGEDYICSCFFLDGYHKIGELPYWSSIRWRQRNIMLLEDDRLNSHNKASKIGW